MNNNTKKLAQEFLKNKDLENMVDFLHGVLTTKELLELSTRIEIVRMLKKGTPQHAIAEELGVGVATVTRGSKEIQQGRFKNV